MAINPWSQSKNLVRNGAQLHANPLGAQSLHNKRMLWQRKPMPDALRMQKQRINKVSIRRGTQV